MHGLYDPQIRKSSVRNFLAYQRVWNDSGHMPPELQHSIRHYIHEPDVPATVDKPITALC